MTMRMADDDGDVVNEQVLSRGALVREEERESKEAHGSL